MDYFTLLTQTGATKITAAAANNTTVNLTHIAVGDGAGSVVMPDASQTALVGETYKTQLSDLKVDDNNSNWLVAVGYIPSDIGNFWVREVGIFDEDGDLIAVGNYPETFKPVMANNVAKDLYISVIIETSNAEAVTLTIDPSIVMASRLYVEENFSNKQHKHDEEYAALGGSELQRFKVADAEEDDEAVNVNQLNSKANISSPAFTGTPTAPTAAVGDSSTKIATTAFVATANNSKANISSPAFTGTPTAPTAAVGTNTTQLATTAFVLANSIQDAQFTQSLATNGYQKLPSGLIIQWGARSVAANSGQTFSFPIAFPTACAGFSTNNYASNYGSFPLLGGRPISNSQFVLQNVEESALTVYWIAIGY